MNFRTTYLLALQSLHVDVPKQLKLPMLKSEVIILSPELCITSYSLSLNFTTLHPLPLAKIWASFLIFLLPYLPLWLVTFHSVHNPYCCCLVQAFVFSQLSCFSSLLPGRLHSDLAPPPPLLPASCLILCTVAGIIFLKCNFDQVI